MNFVSRPESTLFAYCIQIEAGRKTNSQVPSMKWSYKLVFVLRYTGNLTKMTQKFPIIDLSIATPLPNYFANPGWKTMDRDAKETLLYRIVCF